MITVDLNCDLGEVEGKAGELLDARLMPLITSANVACGGHAGDLFRLIRTAELCRLHNVGFGAHPSWPDREGFGRRDMDLPAGELRASLRQQLQLALQAANAVGLPLAHVKPHGALYNSAASSPALSDLLIEVIGETVPGAVVMGLSGCCLLSRAAAAGLAVCHEVFADRQYSQTGTLLPRSHPEAVIHCADTASARLLSILRTRTVLTVEGGRLAVQPETVCVHSDTSEAVMLLEAIHRTLNEAGILIRRRGPIGTGMPDALGGEHNAAGDRKWQDSSGL